jgi:hypothetical protein
MLNESRIGIAGGMLALLLIGLSGCAGSEPLSTRERGTLIGAGGGAATGAVIGAFVGNPGIGAAIGGGLGTAGGAIVGNAMQNNQRQRALFQAQMNQQQAQIDAQRRQIQQLQQQ